MSYSRIAAVTGANKGIGLAIVRQLALQYPKSPLNAGPLLIYLTARDPTRGRDAVAALRRDPALLAARALRSDGGLSEIEFAQLDISDPKSISAFAEFLKSEHPAGIDVVINNASVALDGFDAAVVKQTLQPNYHGTLAATRALLPLLRPGGRLVNVTSSAGSLSKFSPALQRRFRDARKTEEVDALMAEFLAAVEREEASGGLDGWPRNAYAVSKAGATAATACVARAAEESGGGVLVNACCPGWVKTDMTKGRGFKTPDRGAQTPVMLALEDIGGRSGLFWRDEQVIDP